jgi:hypothetical protein
MCSQPSFSITAQFLSAAALICVSPVFADPVVIAQEFNPAVSSSRGFAISPCDVAQKFTVGRAGTLESVEVNVRRSMESVARSLEGARGK